MCQSPGGGERCSWPGEGPLRSAAGAEDPRVRRTDPMCVWHKPRRDKCVRAAT